MKKRVVKETPKQEELILSSELNDSHRIGVEFSSGKRSFVVKVERDMYISCSPRSNTFHEKIRGGSIQKILNNVENVENVFVFDSNRELGEWLIEKL